MSVLCKAAEEGSLSRCRQLLAAGSDVEEKDEFGSTPLVIAAYFGHTEVCELLIAAGSNVEEKNMNGKTPLLLAAQKSQTVVCELLLDKGKSNIEETAPIGNKALKLKQARAMQEQWRFCYQKERGWTQEMRMVSHLCWLQLREATLRCVSCSWTTQLMHLLSFASLYP